HHRFLSQPLDTICSRLAPAPLPVVAPASCPRALSRDAAATASETAAPRMSRAEPLAIIVRRSKPAALGIADRQSGTLRAGRGRRSFCEAPQTAVGARAR